MVGRIFSLSLPLLATAMVLGIVSGALMNAIGAVISPDYFQFFFSIHPFAGSGAEDNVIGSAIGQGVAEGGAYGVVIGLVFSLLVFGVSRGQCAYRSAVPYLFKMLALVWVFWLAGGINGAVYGVFLQRNSSATSGELLRFTGVGGSIWGSYVGCVTGLIFGCSWFARDWKRGKIAGT